MFDPKYKLTDKIVKMLTDISEAKVIIERAKILQNNEIKLRRQAMIRMTHSSTHIEGNMLNLLQVEAIYANKKVDAPNREIYEVANYIKALRYIGKIIDEKNIISEKIILNIHKLVTDKTLPKEESGHYRNRPVYIVRHQFGIPKETIYTAPGKERVQEMMTDLIKWIEESKKEEINPIIVAGIAHQEFAAIHPFIDGNGRTARALATLILYERGYDFRRLFALEEYYNKNRPKYYEAINIGRNYDDRKEDFTNWLLYFIKGFKEEIYEVKDKITSISLGKIGKNLHSQVFLEKEQIKILDFLDQIGRITLSDVIDILECPKRTAQSHLQKLKKLKIILQINKGPSSAYIINQ
jgi:Fic family protein